jgi:predicted NAD/FAD-binding protein
MKADGSPLFQLTTSNGHSAEYDHVILACHSDAALSILKKGTGLTSDEQRILGRFQWNKNEVVLHSDIRVRPWQSFIVFFAELTKNTVYA